MTSALKIAMRFEASNQIGTGHAVRCLTLANALKDLGHQISFLISDETLKMMPVLGEAGFEILSAETHTPCDFLIVDDYKLDEYYEKGARQWAQKIAVIDDLADRKHDCDLLIDQTYGRSAEDYQPLVPPDCRILTGTEYALLRPEFYLERQRAKGKRKRTPCLETLLIFLSGSDQDNVTHKALEGAKILPFLKHIDVVIGQNTTHRQGIEKLIHGSEGSIALHSGLNARQIADLMIRADLSIGAGGTTSWERCALGLPTVLIEIADNQRKIADELEKAGAVINAGWHEDVTPEHLAQILQSLHNDPEALKALSHNAFQVCDSLGLSRVTTALKALFLPSVTLRPVIAADQDLIFQWQNIPETRRYSRNPAPPEAEEHSRWFKRVLDNPECHAYIIKYQNSSVGLLRMDFKKESSYEISILLDPKYHHKGLACAALIAMEKNYKNCMIEAEILPENSASKALFEKSGYKLRDRTWYEKKL